jgi:hypothetical protein
MTRLVRIGFAGKVGSVTLLALLAAMLVCLAGCDVAGTDSEEARAQVRETATATSAAVPSATVTVEPPTLTPVETATAVPSATATDTLVPTLTATSTAVPTETATSTEAATETATAKPLPTQTPTPEAEMADVIPTPVVVNGRKYDAYVPAATKKYQVYHYSCEFDAAWVVLKTYGYDVSFEEQLAIVGYDDSIEPYYEETSKGIVIHGGDILNAYSGDYATNFLARTTGFAMRRVFEEYGLLVTPVRDRESLEAALRRGELVWIKTTADFKPGRPSTWVMPDGRTYETVLGNDHAAVVMGYNADGALIRDVLGPTNTNWNRKYEYLVPWPKFMAAWGSQQYDGLAVHPPDAR